MEKTYFILKVRTSNGVEYWSQTLHKSDDLGVVISNLLSLEVTIIGIKQITLD